MSDRPDWLPEPSPERTVPIKQRVQWGALSFASLLLIVMAGMFLVGAGAVVVEAFRLPGRPLETELIVLGTCALICGYAGAMLRQKLHQATHEWAGQAGKTPPELSASLPYDSDHTPPTLA